MASGALKMKGLLQWCKKHSEGYPGVEVTNFTSSWKDGLAFCSIIHKFRPDLIDFNSLSKENVLENNALAFRVAEQELGIAALLDAEDMVAMRVPDKLCIVTYVSQYYNHLRDKNPEGGPSVQKAVKRPGVTSPTSAPETKRVSKAQTPDKSNGLPAKSKRGTLGDTCTECKKKVYLLERHILEGKLYHRQCYRQSEKGRDNFTARSLSPNSPTKKSFGNFSPTSGNEPSPFQQRQNDTNEKTDSPKKVQSRPRIPDSLVDKSGESKTKNETSRQRQQGTRKESPMETNENDTKEPAWMKWVDKSAVQDNKSPEKVVNSSVVNSGVVSTGAKDKSPDNSGNVQSKFNVQLGKKDSPSSTTPSPEKQWDKKTGEVTGKSGASSKPDWAKSDPKAGLKPVNKPSSSSSQDKLWSKSDRIESKMDTDSNVSDDIGSSSAKTRPMTEMSDKILGGKKDGSTPKSSLSATSIQGGNESQRVDEGAKAGLLKSLAGFRGQGPTSAPTTNKSTPTGKFTIRSDDTPTSSPETKRSKSPLVNKKQTKADSKAKSTATGKFTIRSGDTPTSSPENKRAKSPVKNKQTKVDGKAKPSASATGKFTIRSDDTVISTPGNQKDTSSNQQDKSPSSSTDNLHKGTTPAGNGKSAAAAKFTIRTNDTTTPSTGNQRSKSPFSHDRSPASSAVDIIKLTTPIGKSKPNDKELPVLSKTKRDLSPGVSKFSSPDIKSDVRPSPLKGAGSGDGPSTASNTKPDSTDKKTSPVTRRARSPQKGRKLPLTQANQKVDSHASVVVDVKTRSDFSPSRPLSVLPGGAPPQKPPRTLLRDAKLDNRPEWQIEAEKRQTAIKTTGYKDPEKPWLYRDPDSPVKDDKRVSDYPGNKNPFGSDEVDMSPVKDKKYRSSNPFGSTDTLDDISPEEPKNYKPANPFAGSSSSEDEIENPFDGDDLPMKTSTLRTDEKSHTPAVAISKAEINRKQAWSENRGSGKKRAAPTPPGPNQGTPSCPPPFEGNSRTASPSRMKGMAPRAQSPRGTPGSTPQGSPAKFAARLEPPKPEWVGSPKKNLRKITPDKIEFNRMSSTEIESDSSGFPDSDTEYRFATRSPSVRRSIKSMPAPPHPVPASRRKIITEEVISPDQIIRELDELDRKQTVIESKARILEETIRDALLNESPNEDDLLMQWFEMVNDKNDLVRRESDLVYIGRQQELEEMHAEIEHELRHLMSKQAQLKTPADRTREEELLTELLEVVNQRNNIVENMDEDRLRYEEEDRVIGEMMALKFEGKVNSADEKSKKKKKKDKKKDKKKKKKATGSEFHCIAGQD